MPLLCLPLLAAAPPFITLSKNANTYLRRSTTTIKQQARPSPRFRCAATGGDEHDPPVRRSANYQPNLWTDDYIQSISPAEEEEEENVTRITQLEEDVRKLIIYAEKDAEQQLQLIDHLQQLGVAYRFKGEIKDALGVLGESVEDTAFRFKDNLHVTALLFRLLRENGFSVSEDIFKAFLDEDGNLKDKFRWQKSTRGILSLYEASYYSKEGEDVLDKAMDLTTKQLRCLMKQVETEGTSAALVEADGYDMREHVAHAVELPLNLRMQRLQTRWFIETCDRQPTVNPLLLELAKLDFNAVQKVHKRELAEHSRWWKNLDISRKLPFFRDRLMENYLWTIGWAYEPEHSGYRDVTTKVNCLITLIDDVYDVYGTLHELELFTEAIDRWDVNAIDGLPEYMKLCFLAIFHTANDAAHRMTKEKGLDVLPYLRRAWVNLCKSYLVEAKWERGKYTPKLDEYLDNAWVSISGQLIFTQAYCMNSDLTEEALKSFSNDPQFAQSSSMLLRLYNDLATSSAEITRGDVSKSIQCFMHERNVTEATARLHIKDVLIKKHWKQLNGDRITTCSFEEKIKNLMVNVARTSQFFYGNGDGYGIADGETKKQVSSLLIEPIKLL